MSERPHDQLLTLREVLDITDHSDSTGYRWRHTDIGPRLFKRHGRIVGWKSEVLEWISAQESASTTGGITL